MVDSSVAMAKIIDRENREMANFRSKQLWETRQAVMQVVAAAILVMTITGGVVSWGVARAGDLKDAVEGLEKVTENVESFDGRINVIEVELTGLKQSNNELHEVIRILICQNENPPAGIDCSPTMEQ